MLHNNKRQPNSRNYQLKMKSQTYNWAIPRHTILEFVRPVPALAIHPQGTISQAEAEGRHTSCAPSCLPVGRDPEAAIGFRKFTQKN